MFETLIDNVSLPLVCSKLSPVVFAPAAAANDEIIHGAEEPYIPVAPIFVSAPAPV
jgi:hypothetical protein